MTFRRAATPLPLPTLLLALLLALLALAPPVQAAGQPEAPGDFRNGQENEFGSIAMAPYLTAGESSLPIEASIVLRDLEAVGAAANVLFAFNVKGDAVRATLDSLRTTEGRVLVPVRSATVDDGRQPQAHFAPADLMAAARDGRIELVLSGRVEAKVDSQSHVGAMVIAFDEAWGTLPSGPGAAQLYGFTMVSSTGLGGGVMPFQGQGNTWAMLPVALLAVVVALGGAMAVSALARMPAALPSATPPPSVAAPGNAVPTFGLPASPNAPPPGPSRQAPVPAMPRPSPAGPSAVPVFGGPASPALAPRPTPAPQAAVRPVPTPPGKPMPPTTAAAPDGPMQGPRLPPHPLDRSPGLLAKPSPPPGRVAHVRPAPRPAADGPVLTATKRPKAKPAGGTVASAGRTPPAKRVVQQRASR